MKRTFLAPLVVLVGALLACAGTEVSTFSGPRGFGERIAIPVGTTVALPDFTVRRDGPKRKVLPGFGREVSFEAFTVTAGADEIAVNWSPGTGLFAPARFSVQGRRFALERMHSESLGRLGEDDIVIVRRDL